MVQHYKKDLIDLKKASIASIWKNWIVIAFILTFGFVNVNAEQRCCYSTSSQITSSSSNIYKLNVTASHVDSEKAGNEYFVAISFQQGYSVIGDPYSPFSKVTCSLTPGTIPQYNCHSKDSKTFFVVFDLSIQPPPSPNSTITASSVFIFSDKCQNVPFCTNLAEKHESEDSDKVSLGPLGTWPKYAVIIGGVILGISLLVACYLVYRRNRPDESYRDTSITPGTTYNDKNRIFAPNSLLRNGDDDDLPPPNGPPKNTLIQFGNVSTRSPERSKSVKNTTLTSKPSTKTKREKNHHEIEIKSDDDKIPSVIIDMNGNNNLERSKSHKSKRSNNSKDNNNVNNRLSGYSTSELSKTISNNDISDRELSDNNNNEEIYSSNTKKYSTSSTSLHRSKSKIRNSVEESRRSSNNNHNNSNNSHNNNSSINSHNNNNNNHKPHRRPTSRGAEEDRDGHKIDRKNSRRHRSNSRTRKNSSPPPPASRTLKSVEVDRDGHKIDRINSRRHRSHSRSRKSSSSPPPASKSTSDLQKSLSTRQIDRKKSFSNDRETGKNNNVSSRSSGKKSIKHNDLISNADTESTASSSDIPLGDKLPLAMLVTKMPSSGQLNSWKPDKVINEDDDDTTPLGRISSFGATSTSSQSRLPSTDKLTDDIIDYYDSILNEVLGVNDDDDDNPIRKSLKINKNKEKEKETVNDDEEIPIGQLRSG